MTKIKVNSIQEHILDIAYAHAKVNKTPVTLHELVAKLPDVKPRTVRASVEALVKKGYFRHGIKIKNRCCYIIIRTRSANYEEKKY